MMRRSVELRTPKVNERPDHDAHTQRQSQDDNQACLARLFLFRRIPGIGTASLAPVTVIVERVNEHPRDEPDQAGEQSHDPMDQVIHRSSLEQLPARAGFAIALLLLDGHG